MENLDQSPRRRLLKRIGKILLSLLITILIGIFIGMIVAGQNPFLMFWPPTWFHLIEFLQ